MKLKQFKLLLAENRNKQFLIQLPDQSTVPLSFHVTEVGQIDKTFIDCGGKMHSVQTCQLQVWVGDDVDHRLNTGKLADILQLASSVVPDDDIELEIEYEHTVISQYPIQSFWVTDDSVTLHLTTKHTDCLAKEICLIPSSCEGTGCC